MWYLATAAGAGWDSLLRHDIQPPCLHLYSTPNVECYSSSWLLQPSPNPWLKFQPWKTSWAGSLTTNPQPLIISPSSQHSGSWASQSTVFAFPSSCSHFSLGNFFAYLLLDLGQKSSSGSLSGSGLSTCPKRPNEETIRGESRKGIYSQCGCVGKNRGLAT